MTLQHIVLFSFPRELTREEAADMRGMVSSWPSEIGLMTRCRFGTDLTGARTRGYTYLLYTEFPDVAALDAYRAHPVHQRFLDWLMERDCTPLAFDFHLDSSTVLMPEGAGALLRARHRTGGGADAAVLGPLTASGPADTVRGVDIRRANDEDWPLIYPFYAAVMAEGKTYPFPERQTLDEARPWWMEEPPGQTVVAVSDGVILGSAKMGPNRPGRGAHVATASFLVDPAHQGRGVGRALGEYVLDWCRSEGFASIQFNAVVEANAPAVHLWQSLGFEIIGTVPESFDHPDRGLVGLHIMFRHL